MLAAYFRRNPHFYVYHLGDLDDFFFPDTAWYPLPDEKHPRSIALLFTKFKLPVLLHMAPEITRESIDDVRELAPILPDRLYAHLSPTLVDAYAAYFRAEPHGDYLKMGLADILPPQPDTSAVPLTEASCEEVAAFCDEQYPGNWFEPEMLATGYYRGIRETNRLIAIAGVHSVSREYGAAALGNVVTHKDMRGCGLGRETTLAVCHALQNDGVDVIGLNVNAANEAAIRCYRGLGFIKTGEYTEVMLTR
jgi:ribosomal protein S18 acetylase RimI-like enzyme